MSSAPHIALNGHAVRALTLRVGNVGPWVADVELTEAPSIAGRVALTIGTSTLVGTIVAQQSASFGLAFGARVVGGGGGWGTMLGPKGYHNDAGVKASLLAEDAAREAGEQLGAFAPERERVGVDYARRHSTASSVLELAAGSAPWWVDYAGVTHVGARAEAPLVKGSYELLNFDSVENVATLAVDDFGAVQIGSVLSDERLGGSRIVRDLELSTRDNSPLRATVWCGGASAGLGRLPGIVRRLIERVNETRMWGCYRYRVVSVGGDRRCDLQAARADAGVPDLRNIAQWPGVPGVSAELTAGAEVLVSFVDGDPSEPVLTHYVGPGGVGYVPVGVVLGGDSGPPAARQGDAVEVLLPPAQFVGTVILPAGPAPATGVVSWLVPKADGTIVGGSGKVRVAT